ncbi:MULTISPECIES: DUF4382 domain-containing protein [unclassified Pseudoalteromonas]|uniref:DUF4382 domain-containing protein n=1 Tax=unclassified Pseudoalteromonas TaxID=194690 RepID=UPI000CF5EE71|nr:MULTISPECIES: DUF4382 domain-containing protein [unclassified Pseudoalteromonas]MBS3798895.1 DUF4382 domain-containing protein [Pseudoalteromonas sp. BDTF-M6]
MNKLLLATAISATLLTGCGGSSDDNNEPMTAQFTLGVSDAPVSNAKEVWVAFDSIIINAADGERPTFETRTADGEPVMVNLLEFTGSDVFGLINDEVVAPGEYAWLRANIINGDEANIEMTSHIVYNDDTVAPLVVNRKNSDGIGEIQINDFTLAVGENQFVLEFDLKKSLVDPSNSEVVNLKPTGIRLENLAEVEDIEGTVSSAMMETCEADNIALAPETGTFGHAVYLYSGDVVEPKDLYVDGETSPADAPIATASVVMNEETGMNEFEIGFVAAGNYKLAYTCAAHLDDAEVLNEEVTLYSIQDVTVVAGEDANVTFDIAE